MKELLIQRLQEIPDAFHRRSTAREYLQGRILLSLQDQGAFSNWAFVGGTALRFLFNLPRYSEDLDFSLVGGAEDAWFEKRMDRMCMDLNAEAYRVDAAVRQNRAVASAFIKFRGLLFETGISPHRDEVLSVKVEIDTRPPDGAILATRLVRRHFMLNLLHYDRASLLAGKLHALLSRPYTKGRDLYDLVWYLADPAWPGPNITLLRNALQQTGWSGERPTEANWRHLLTGKLEQIDWKAALADVNPFLERPADAALINQETVLSLLR